MDQYGIKKDVLFKTFWGRKRNEVFLKSFLSLLLNIKIYKCKVFQEVALEKLFSEEKGGSLDILVEINDNTIINIEMQRRNEFNIEDRTKYYSSKIISRDVARRNWL